MKKIGIIVGRFQVPELNNGQKSLLDYAISRYDLVFVMVEKSRNNVIDNTHPLPFEAIKNTLASENLAGVYGFEESDNLEQWTKNLDEAVQINIRSQYQEEEYELTLLGCRWSEIEKYKGSIPVFFTPKIQGYSGEATRKVIARNFTPTWGLEERKLAVWMMERSSISPSYMNCYNLLGKLYIEQGIVAYNSKDEHSMAYDERDQVLYDWEARVKYVYKVLEDTFTIRVLDEIDPHIPSRHRVTIDSVICMDLVEREIAETNPLLKKVWGIRDGLIPICDIKSEHLLPALNEMYESYVAYHESILSGIDTPNFENTIGHGKDYLDFNLSNRLFDRATEIIHVLQKTRCLIDFTHEYYHRCAPILQKFEKEDTAFDGKLNNLIKAIDPSSLSGQELRAYQQSMAIIEDGVYCSAEVLEEYNKVVENLKELRRKYNSNMEFSSGSIKVVCGESEFLSEFARRTKDGYMFTESQYLIQRVMTYCSDPDIREQVLTQYNALYTKGKYNNLNVVCDILDKRHTLATIWGKETYSDYVFVPGRRILGYSSAKSFLLNLAKPVISKLEEECEQYGITKKSDYLWIAENTISNILGVDNPREIRNYFEYHRVLEGFFWVVRELYGITFIKIDEIPSLRIEAYEVHDAGKVLGVIQIDPFSAGKGSGGASSSALRTEKKLRIDENTVYDQRPVAYVDFRITLQQSFDDEDPGGMQFNDVLTIFHEFGHALHLMFSDVEYPENSYVKINDDFLEYASIFMEYFAFTDEFLDRVAIHNVTGEKMPETLKKRIQESDKYFGSYSILRSIQKAILDLEYNTQTKKVKNVIKFENDILSRLGILGPLPRTKGECISVSFPHAFLVPGYESNYYSYILADVLSADTFKHFLDNGLFNKDLAQKLRSEVWSAGSSDQPLNLFRNFMGRDFDIKPFLEFKGLLKPNK